MKIAAPMGTPSVFLVVTCTKIAAPVIEAPVELADLT
jgi:hypothetical protein